MIMDDEEKIKVNNLAAWIVDHLDYSSDVFKGMSYDDVLESVRISIIKGGWHRAFFDRNTKEWKNDE